MATRPPAPPPRGSLTPPDGGDSLLRTVLKVLAYGVGAVALLMIVGTGFLLATCAGS